MYKIRALDRFLSVVFSSEIDRPYLKSLTSDVCFCLVDEIDQWCQDMNIVYQIKRYDDIGKLFGRYIVFENKEDLILFKLTWC